jgi:GntR family transcriptional regulator/MocR family aminotransferase
MAVTQDQFSPDLLIGIDRNAAEPLRAQLERALRDAVREGRLHAGTRLPSTRALATELGLSRGVVVEAYAQLAAEGYLVARQGAPTRVAAVTAAGAADHGRAGGPHPPPASSPDVAATMAHARQRWTGGATPTYDLRPWAPDLASFPRSAWAASIRTALRTAPDAALGNAIEPRGAPDLRATLAAYLGRSRGVATDAAHLVVTAGMTGGVAAVAAALRGRGVRRIAVEDPGFSVHRLLLARSGLETVPISVDDDGIDVGALARTDAEAVLVAPAHQYPLGAVLAPERRTALLAWARDRDALVLEDDYDGEYRYDREPVGALQGLDPDRVAYLGSASKMLAPALRLGWAALPRELVGDVALSAAAAGGAPMLDQLALADLIERGELDRHLRRMRPVYRARREALLRAIAAELPGARVTGIAAGLSFVLHLDGLDEEAACAAAGERGIAVWALGSFRAAPAPGDATGLVIGYGALPEAAARRAVAALAEAVSA